MSSLDHIDVQNIAHAAEDFVRAYKAYKQEPAAGLKVAVALSRLGILEECVDLNVSRETSVLEAKLDGQGSEEPPF